MYDAILIERNKYPEYRGVIGGKKVAQYRLLNASCGDDVTIYARRDGDVLTKVRWEGKGCAIALVSADVFCEVAEGKTVVEMQQLAKELDKMLRGETSTAEELRILECVARMPARVKCAKLAWSVMCEMNTERNGENKMFMLK